MHLTYIILSKVQIVNSNEIQCEHLYNTINTYVEIVDYRQTITLANIIEVFREFSNRNTSEMYVFHIWHVKQQTYEQYIDG